MRLLAWLFVSALLVSAAARGAEPSHLTLSGAGHVGVVEGDGISWTTTYVLSPSSSDGGRLALAAPVPADTIWIVEGTAVVPVRDAADRVIALDVGRAAPREKVRGFALDVQRLYPLIEVRSFQPLSGDSEGLRPPLAAGDVLQRVAVKGSVVQADPELGADRHIRRSQNPEVRRSAIRRLDRQLGHHGRAGALYVQGDARIAAARGIAGIAVAKNAVSSSVSLGIAALFALVIALMVSTARVLDRQVRRERIDTYLRTEFGKGDVEV